MERLEDRERDSGLPVTNDPDGGIAWMVHRWAAGHQLEAVLRGSDIAAGDFVRRCKQIVDLLDQVADAAVTSGSPRLALDRPLGRRRGAARSRGGGPDGLTGQTPRTGPFSAPYVSR